MPTKPSSILYLNNLVQEKYKQININNIFKIKNDILVGNNNKLNNVDINEHNILTL